MSPLSRTNLEAATKDAWNRWLPTLVAIAGVIGTLLYESRDYGRLEQRVTAGEARQVELVNAIEKLKENMIPRSEYTANISEVKNSFARSDETQKQMSLKLDRLLELVYAGRGKAQ